MELAALLAGQIETPPEWADLKIAGLTADSRDVRPGYLFAALPGTKTDGARFAAQALEQGAVAILAAPGALDARSFETAVLLTDANPRRRLALLAARFFGAQPSTIAAVTGTNGKTSVAGFVRQIWAQMGEASASLGTLGVISPGKTRPLQHTTPDPVELQKLLKELKEEGVEHLAIEASSHGLAQHRLDGVHVSAAGFTNISRDHLDYHADFDDYFFAKMRLFGEVMMPCGVAVINMDAERAWEVEALSWARGHKIIGVGEQGDDIRLVRQSPLPHGQALTIDVLGKRFDIDLPLVGLFQASNVLVALGLVIGCGGDVHKALAALPRLETAAGRMELIGTLPSGAAAYVDYAHTPDALANVLASLRPHTEKRLIAVFGCGGDRDKGKRPQMGKIAAELADVAIVTDDNPRTEDAAAIRAEVLAGASGLREIGDRSKAIRAAVGMLEAGDLLVVAGKGHETGQIIGSDVIPFDDREEVRKALLDRGGAA